MNIRLFGLASRRAISAGAILLLIGVYFLFAGTGLSLVGAHHVPELPVDTVYNVTFRTNNQSTFGPFAGGSIKKTISLIDQTWDVSLSVGDITTVLDEDFGGTLSASTKGQFAMEFVAEATAGDVDVIYPVAVTISSPPKDSFRPGDTDLPQIVVPVAMLVPDARFVA